MGIIQCYDNLSDKISLYWPVIKGAGINSFNLYCSKRKSGTYTFIKNVANVPALDGLNVLAEVRRSVDLVPISANLDDHLYFKYTTIDRAGVESNIALSLPTLKLVYPQGVQLKTDPYLVEIDHQDSGATDIDFTTTDRFPGLLLQVIISRSTTSALNVDISIKSDNHEMFLENIVGSTDKSIVLDYNQNIIPYDMSDVRVKTTGISGGSLSVSIARKRFYIPSMGI